MITPVYRRLVRLNIASRFDYPDQFPPLGFRHGTAFDNLNEVSLPSRIVFVMHVTHGPAADDFPVNGMLVPPFDLDSQRLVHFVAGDDTRYRFLHLLILQVPNPAEPESNWL